MDLAPQIAQFRQEILSAVRVMIGDAIGNIRQPNRIVDVPVVLGVPGTAIATGAHVFFRLGLNGVATVLQWSLAATKAGVATNGAVTVDVRTGTTLATVATICGTGRPALAAQSELSDQNPTNWTAVTIADASWMYVTTTAVDNSLEVISLTLRLGVTPR